MTAAMVPPVAQGAKVAPAQPPAQPTAQTPLFVSTVPTTKAQIRELRARRDEISSQIGNITGRRDDIAGQLRAAAPGADKAGLEARLAALDSRIVGLETDLNVTGRQLASAKGDAAAYSEQTPPGTSNQPSAGQVTAISIVFTLAVLMPLTIAFARRVFSRGPKQTSGAPSPEIVQRLDRMDEGIEAIAIEIERISEGQRFVTRLLAEGSAPALSAGAAEPIGIPLGERVAAERRI